MPDWRNLSAAQLPLRIVVVCIILPCVAMAPPKFTQTRPVRPNTPGAKIKALRERLSLSQTALADRLGVTVMTVSRWEHNMVEVPTDGFLKLARLCHGDEALYFLRLAGVTLGDIEKWWADSAVARTLRRPR